MLAFEILAASCLFLAVAVILVNAKVDAKKDNKKSW
jgi:hypothetical protein